MTKTVKIILISLLILIMAVFVVYCVRFGKTPDEKMTENPLSSADDALQAAVRLKSAAETAWENGNAKCITLSDDGSSASAADVLIQGNTVTVTSAGVYSVSGRLTEGRLTVDCEGTVVLILNSVEIANSLDAAIHVSNADHTLIYLPEGSASRLVSGTGQEITAADGNTDIGQATGAALYARDSLSFAGSGKLTVCGYINNAVATTDQLIVLNGELEMKAVSNGLKGKDSVTVLDGRITVHSGNDGIKSNNDVQADCGNIDIRGGEINIISFGDGMHAEKELSVEDGGITISAGDRTSSSSGESVQSFENLPDHMQNGMKPQEGTPPERPQGTPQEHGERADRPDHQADSSGDMRGQGEMEGDFPDMFDREWSYGTDSEASTKGLKSGGNLTVSGGSITVDSVDDCIHANGSITVTGGTFRLSSGDDGFHADDTLAVSAGDITVLQSYEGLEGRLIYLDGGNISVTASDDGINAGGGSAVMFGGIPGASDAGDTSLSVLKISGGTLYVNAAGDGLDSNGDLIVEGGNIIVDGPVNSGNGALDSGAENGGSIVCNGGTVLAIGASGMAESFGSTSEQCSFMKNFSGTLQAGTEITIADETGKTVFEHKSAKTFNSVVFSSPLLEIGKTYTVSAGDQTETITMESVSNGDSSGFGMPGGFGGKGRK